jgi:hypothetical protein
MLETAGRRLRVESGSAVLVESRTAHRLKVGACPGRGCGWLFLNPHGRRHCCNACVSTYLMASGAVGRQAENPGHGCRPPHAQCVDRSTRTTSVLPPNRAVPPQNRLRQAWVLSPKFAVRGRIQLGTVAAISQAWCMKPSTSQRRFWQVALVGHPVEHAEVQRVTRVRARS